MPRVLINVAIRYEHDVVLARQRARQIAALLGFDPQDQVRIATAVSEIARNAFRYGRNGRAEFRLTNTAPPTFQISIADQGPGISDLQKVLNGNYISQTGMGLGILGARRLMDDFQIDSDSAGTRVLLAKRIPAGAAGSSSATMNKIATELARQPSDNPFEEVQRQNQELLAALSELERRQSELAVLNRELEDTNRGVVALYAELEERADYLRRASEVKTQFLSNMTHEFRTPLNSILSLSRILLDRLDGELNGEQQRQVKFIEKAAKDLSEIVDDLLDLAKVEAGKVVIRPVEFTVADLFGALRGMLRPLLTGNASVSLLFEEPTNLPALHTDESKMSQILRNLISNALKFTERGEVRVAARSEPGWIAISVTDTGIGISVTDRERIFEEFTQVEGAHQRGKQGTGLGLPLSRKLAALLGGTLTVTSEVGLGSVFTLRIPIAYEGPKEVTIVPDVTTELDPARLPVLVIEDNLETLFVYEKYFKGTPFQPLPARTLKQAQAWLRQLRPVAIILDIMLAHESTWTFLSEFKQQLATRDIPVLVITMVANQAKALALGADAFHEKPIDRSWLLHQLARIAPAAMPKEVLLIDDDDASRYVLAGLLADTPFRPLETASSTEGLRLARERHPAAIFLDLTMPDLNGLKLLEVLKTDALTKNIPIVIHTSKNLSPAERTHLEQHAVAILNKNHADRRASLQRIHEILNCSPHAHKAPTASFHANA
jgi:signal transduction histidine kinase/CheY-like chemotaxis protein